MIASEKKMPSMKIFFHLAKCALFGREICRRDTTFNSAKFHTFEYEGALDCTLKSIYEWCCIECGSFQKLESCQNFVDDFFGW